MKSALSFKEYLKDIEGYRSNKIENPTLSYQEYQEYSYGKPKGILTLEEVKTIEFEAVSSKMNEIRKIYLNLELKNYQKVVEKYLINEDFLKRNLTIKDLKNMSNDLLKNLTDYPFNLIFTKAFQPVWDKKEQRNIPKNIRGEFRATNLIKENISFRPPIEIEKNLKEILTTTQKILKNPQASKEEKIRSLALFHLNYELIHPFGEGNGRTGRILLIMLSLKAKIIPPAFGIEKSERLTTVKVGTYCEEIEKVLKPKQEKKDWNLFSQLPQSFRDFYLVSLDSTLVEGQKWLKKNQKKNLINFYFSNYNIQEESDFFDFAKWIKTKIQDLLVKQETEEQDYLTLGLETNDKEKSK